MEEDQQVRITFRLPLKLRQMLSLEAEKNNRSMNAEIIARLERSFISSGREATIEEIKAVLFERDKSAFEESVNAALKRFKEELLNQK